MKQVLTIGNCSYDHGNLTALIGRHFTANVVQAHVRSDGDALLRERPWDLVIVNRKFDRDQDDGLELIRSMKADAALAKLPVMLLTNFPEYQQQAIAAGAEPGFGKSALDAAETVETLGKFLG